MKAVLDFFLDWKVKLAALIFACILAYSWHTVQVHNAVSVAKIQTQNEVAAIYNKRIENLKKESDKAQSELKATHSNILKERNAEIKRANSERDAALHSLRNRESRPGSKYGLSVPASNGESGQFVDGTKLYYDDSRFLVWLATRTEGLKIELQSCYKAYDTARDTLERFKNEHQGM